MTRPDYDSIVRDMCGKTVPKPPSGTLSGHAAGEPFDKKVYTILKERYPDTSFRQYEYLNDLYSKNPNVTGTDRYNLITSETARLLLKRGKDQTVNWSLTNQFDEKQNDTADNLIVYEEGGHLVYEIIDVKTRNESKKAQAPNIISALKLAEACRSMIDNNDYDCIHINYLELNWILDNDELKCTNGCHADLFKCDPRELYINWAAALQIQFHVCDLPQSYNGDKKAWCYRYLNHFVDSAKKRIDTMSKEFVLPFQDYATLDKKTDFANTRF